MTLELNYDKSLHHKEHKAGPFEITPEMIQAVNASLGEKVVLSPLTKAPWKAAFAE